MDAFGLKPHGREVSETVQRAVPEMSHCRSLTTPILRPSKRSLDEVVLPARHRSRADVCNLGGGQYS